MRALLVALLLLAVAAPAAGAAIEWSRSGGFAGLSDDLRIRTDRTAIATSNGATSQRRLSARRYARLRELLRDADLGSLKPSYPNPGAADTFQYRVRFGGHTVRADETRVPDRLWPALRALSRIHADVRGTARLQVPQLAALAQARRRWRAAGLRSYDFRLRVFCFCPGAGEPRTIRVRDGRVQNRREDASFLIDSVPRMFREIERVLRDPDSGDVTVEYHPELGFPREASLDRIEAAIDDELSWRAYRLRSRAR